jgi:hypothetical protein
VTKQSTHLMVGTVSGVGVAAYTARDQQPWDFVAEAIAGGLGGALGSLSPDLIEPAVHSWHHTIAHSYMTAAVGTVTVRRSISSWQARCRTEANRRDQLRKATSDPWLRFWRGLVAFFWRMLSGFAVGAATGYLSHLALDAVTPRGIPLLA